TTGIEHRQFEEWGRVCLHEEREEAYARRDHGWIRFECEQYETRGHQRQRGNDHQAVSLPPTRELGAGDHTSESARIADGYEQAHRRQAESDLVDHVGR